MTETEVCGRCGGSGEYSWNATDGSMCYGCNGTGWRRVQRGGHVSAYSSRYDEEDEDEDYELIESDYEGLSEAELLNAEVAKLKREKITMSAEIDDLKSKLAKQRNEIARLTQKVAELAADKLEMHRDMLVLKQRLKENRDA